MDRLLRFRFLCYITEHQHGADHGAGAVSDRRATVGNGALTAVTRNQYRVVLYALDRAILQGLPHRENAGFAGLMIDDMEYLIDLAVDGFRLRPTSKMLGNGIEERHAPQRVGGDQSIAYRLQRHGELFLAGLKGVIRLLQPFARISLNIEQLLG